MRNIDSVNRDYLVQLEGIILFAYDDNDPPKTRRKIKQGDPIRGTLTIGVGHTGPDVRPGMVISTSQAMKLLDKDLDPVENWLTRNVKVPLTDNQFAALVIWGFNVGVGAMAESGLIKKLNQGNYAAVPSELAKWNKTTVRQANGTSKKVVSPGLINRRAAEAGLWVKGAFVQSSGTPASVSKPPLISQNAAAVATTLVSGGALQLFGKGGPLDYVLGFVVVAAVIFLAVKYIKRRTES